VSGKLTNLALITTAQVLALALWFSGTAAGPGMAQDSAAVAGGFQALLTGAVQAGFVLGTLVSAIFALPDRHDPRGIFAAAALAGAAANAAILLLPAGHPAAIGARFATGLALAGVYPIGMKLSVGWADRNDTGLVVGLLVGGLTLGSASPHLVNALGGVSWRAILAAASLAAIAGAGLIGLTRLGPRHAPGSAFRPAAALQIWRNRGIRLATLGYLGHMWELYAMWAWVGLYLAASFAAWRGTAGTPPASGLQAGAMLVSLATFAVIALGAVGSIGGGLLADRIGRVRVTVGAMAISCLCCLLAGPAFGLHPLLTTGLCAVWGVAVVADSAQFSASVAEMSEPGLTGTMLTVQNCLGFTLTLVTIQLMPLLVAHAGWGGAFAVLSAGPALGCLAMLRLRRSPAAARLAGGRG
jgi:MFS family permease